MAEAAAVAAPDPERGSVVRAIVVLREGEPSDELVRELQEHVKAVTAPYKYPRIVEFADELPRTSSGKVKRAQGCGRPEPGATGRRYFRSESGLRKSMPAAEASTPCPDRLPWQR